MKKKIKKSLAELEDQKILKSWHDCGRQNFVITDEDGAVICFEYKKTEIPPTKKIDFILEPSVLYNGEHPVYRN